MNNVPYKLHDNVINVERKTAGLRRHAEELNKLVTDSLGEALLSLMADKPYAKITVTELCKKAGVSRAAFYGNYSSKDDIFDRIVNVMNADLVNKLGSPFRSTTTEKWYAKMFKYISARADIFKLIIAAGFDDRYMALLNEKVLADAALAVEKKYQRIIWSGGIQKIVTHWLDGGMAESVDTMAKLCSKYFVAWSINDL